MAKTKSEKAPIIVRVLALLMLIGGVWSVFIALPAFLLFGLYGVLSLLTGVIAIVVAFGLDKMKKWGLYGFTVMFGLMVSIAIISYIGTKSLGLDFWDLIVLVALVYMWNIRKQFK